MKQVVAADPGPLLLLHGGAGPLRASAKDVEARVASLTRIAKRALRALLGGAGALEVASGACRSMERDPLFNAGLGSALQADGAVRLSAALMVGSRQRFSGVVNASFLTEPSGLCVELQRRSARVLTNPGAELLARELALPVRSNLTKRRASRWIDAIANSDYEPLGEPSFRAPVRGSDTVGCLLRTARGGLVAAASTGGRGFEYPGRVSDTCTVAGTYASRFAAVAATGVGEEIVDDALAARLETRVRDGMPLSRASALCFREAVRAKRAYGWIGLSRDEWCVAHTTAAMPYVVVGSRGGRVTLISSSLNR